MNMHKYNLWWMPNQSPGLDEWLELVSRVSVGGAIPVKFSIYSEFTALYLFAGMNVPAVDDIPNEFQPLNFKKGTNIPVSGTYPIPENLHTEGEAAMLKFIRKCALHLYTHELDEQLTVVKDGESTRPYDPHKPIVLKHPVEL